jgi:glutathione peroxidase
MILEFALSFLISAADTGGTPKSLYSFTAQSIEGKAVELNQFKGKVTLVVNTASQCGYTPQYKELEELYEKYRGKGFLVLGFPSNDFGGQEPGSNSEIHTFCQTRYGVTFPLFTKASVTGPSKQAIFRFLTENAPTKLNGEVRWNFTKFLVNKTGQVVARFDSKIKPSDNHLTQKIEELLKQRSDGASAVYRLNRGLARTLY